MVNCDTTLLKLTVTKPILTVLPSGTYEGDYFVMIRGAASTFVVETYQFMLRVINPCFNFAALACTTCHTQAIITSTIDDMSSSVLLASQPIKKIFTAFKDYASNTYGNNDGYTLCGARTYTPPPTTTWPTWLTMSQSTEFAVNSVTRATDVGIWTITVIAGLVSYPNVTASTTFKVDIADCVLTAFTAPNPAISD
jgi:hypothetical protein